MISCDTDIHDCDFVAFPADEFMVTEKEALQKFKEVVEKKARFLRFEELQRAIKVSKGSLHRWIRKWKMEKKIGFEVRPKIHGVGVEEVYGEPEVAIIEKKLEEYLERNKILKSKWLVVTDETFFRAAAESQINSQSGEFKIAKANVIKKQKLALVPEKTYFQMIKDGCFDIHDP